MIMCDYPKSQLSSYLVGKSVVPHASVYRYVKETRIGDENSVGEALEQIPQEFVTDAISLGNPTAGLTDLDLVVFATLNELLEAEAEVAATKCAVAHLPFGTVARDSGRATVESAQQILEVVVYELSVNGLVFPIPATLAELQKIRTTPAMQAFRSTFQPWIDALSQGQLADKRVLRAEVAAASRAFRNYPRIEAFSNFLMYISLPASFIPDPIIGLILGLGLGIAGIGLPKLAERWRQRSSWLSLCQKTGNSARL